MSYSFREKLEKKIIEHRQELIAGFINSRESDPYETGESRGAIRKLGDILEMCSEVERDSNDSDSTSLSARTVEI